MAVGIWVRDLPAPPPCTFHTKGCCAANEWGHFHPENSAGFTFKKEPTSCIAPLHSQLNHWQHQDAPLIADACMAHVPSWVSEARWIVRVVLTQEGSHRLSGEQETSSTRSWHTSESSRKEFDFVPLGERTIKGKGLLSTFLVKVRRSNLSKCGTVLLGSDARASCVRCIGLDLKHTVEGKGLLSMFLEGGVEDVPK
eukprot:1157372-Pelagomonas_calceolata.AAC.5